ncbi:3-oxoacyl-ACP synthase III family protein [Saccharothrix variisporea]|uniref:3-oxoacyl-[acyl-carrier-protein] synthase-3 n=1 Tax=Saccharothrix variisporea TaxID=543527 RepID=A0A495X868_9PSEU|nr:ketoacyl-ACP synthase III [Saccharothrix variisporea]RKT70202.1 3-oxoacyl-[acyl-carrier-protein] synthase-3 [Saccharothrix variisporea]
MSTSVGILGTGSAVPARAVSNEDLARRVPGAEPDWVVRKTAIRSRRFAAPEEATSDLAARAAARALADAGLGVDRVDYLIVSTSTPDHPQPPTACLVQDRLGAYGAACWDVNAVCAGFVHGLVTARALVADRPGAHALVVGADVYSRILDFADRRTAVLFGDGAGAAVVGAVPAGRGVVAHELASRGDAAELIRVEAGGSRFPASPETLAEGAHFFRMIGRGVSEIVLAEVPPFVDKLLARAGVSAEDVRHVVPHQPNGVLLGELVRACGLTAATTHRTVEEYANVGSASVPLTLDHANRAGLLHPGDLVLLLGFGGGMSFGACLLRW